MNTKFRKWQRPFAFILTVIMVFAIFPVSALAASSYTITPQSIGITMSADGTAVSADKLVYDASASGYDITYSAGLDMSGIDGMYTGLGILASAYRDSMTFTGTFHLVITLPSGMAGDADMTTAVAGAQDAGFNQLYQIDSAILQGNIMTITFSFKNGITGATFAAIGNVPNVNISTVHTLPASAYSDGSITASASLGGTVSVGIPSADQDDMKTQINTYRSHPFLGTTVQAIFPSPATEAVNTLVIGVNGTGSNALNTYITAESTQSAAQTVPIAMNVTGSKVSGSDLAYDPNTNSYDLKYSATANMINITAAYDALRAVAPNFSQYTTFSGSMTFELNFPMGASVANKYTAGSELLDLAKTQLSKNPGFDALYQVDSATLNAAKTALTVTFSFKAGTTGQTIAANNGIPSSLTFDTADMLTLPANAYKNGTLSATETLNGNINIGIPKDPNNDNSDYQSLLMTRINAQKNSSDPTTAALANAMFPGNITKPISAIAIKVNGNGNNVLNMYVTASPSVSGTSQTASAPQTGDSGNVLTYILLVCTSAGAFVIALKKKKYTKA